jgi:hypothetical protein
MSLSVIRGLLERNLVERAAALAETRWHGAGPLVRLAHEWATLTPLERRDRLSEIGPEDLARLRGIAELQPDLARVLDDLEARGVIPPAEALVADAGGAQLTAEEQVVDAVLDVAQERAEQFADDVQVARQPVIDDVQRRLNAARQAGPGGPAEPQPLSEMGQEFIATELERRAAATERAEAILDRVRQRVSTSSDRIGAATALSAAVVGAPTLAADATAAPTIEADVPGDDAPVVDVAPGALLQAVMTQKVHELPLDPTRSPEAALRAVARALGLGFVRIDADRYSGKQLYGGLVRKGRGVVEEAGFLPRALAGRNLIAYSGRIYPTALARIDEGFFDIPGTRASTEVHPDSRLVLLGELT